MNVVMGVALQVEQQPVADALCGIPGMRFADFLIPAIGSFLAQQTVMLDVVHQFQQGKSHEALNDEKHDAPRAIQHRQQTCHQDRQRHNHPHAVGG